MKRCFSFLIALAILFSSAAIRGICEEEGYSTFYNLVFVNDEFIDRMLRGGVSSVDLEKFLDDIDEQISMFQEKIYSSDMDVYFIYLFLQTLQKEEHIDSLLAFDMMYQDEMLYMLEERKCPESLRNLMMTSFGDKIIVGGTLIEPDTEDNDYDNENENKNNHIDLPAKVEIPFKDISEADWFAESVVSLYDKKIVSGKPDGLFYPRLYITREEAIKLIVSAIEFFKEEKKETDTGGLWYVPYLDFAKEHSLLYGIYSETEFVPGENITRQDMATICHRAIKSSGINLKYNNPATDFYDISEFKYYAVEPIKELQQAGIIRGVGNNLFAPGGYMTRAEAAVIINNIIKNL